MDYEQPSAYIVNNTEYTNNKTLTPVLTANKSFVLGYTEEQYGIYTKGECIIFDDFTMDIKYVNFPFKVKSSAIKILTAKTNVNLYFVYELMTYMNLTAEEHKRHYITEVADISIPDISKQEQDSIANALSKIKQKQGIEESLLDLLGSQKTYLLRQMFI